jgi:hypothetical protein
MAFWSDDIAGASDPKRKYRFTVEFPGLTGLTEDTAVEGGGATTGIVWYAKSVTKPSFSLTETDHTFLDKKFYYPGRLEWATVTLTLVDPADPTQKADAVQQMNKIVKKSGYQMFKSPETLGTISKGKASQAMGTIVINQINSEGTTIEQWVLRNPFVKDLKFGDLDYTGDELIELSMEIRYDWAECTVGGETYFGRAIQDTDQG